MSDVLLEVRQAMKQERMEKFWKNYGSFIIGLLVLLVLSTAANEGYKAWKSDQNKKQSVVFLDALDSKDDKALLEKTAGLQNGLKTLAQLKAAGGFTTAADTQNAIAVYTDIIKNKDAEPEFKQIAEYALLHLDTALTAEEKVLRFSQMWADANNAMRFHAKLDAAVILANDLKKYKEAREQLQMLEDTEGAPKTLKQKATSLNILYTVLQTAQEQSTGETPAATSN